MAMKADAVALHFVPTDGGTWAGFLKTKLSEKRYGINVTFFNANHSLQSDSHHGPNILLVSPDFLNIDSFDKYSGFNSSTSLIVLLGTTDEDFKSTCDKKKNDSLITWPVFETQANESSVRALLVEIIDLYEQAHSLDIPERSDDSDDFEDTHSDSVANVASESDAPNYDVLPPPRPVHSHKPSPVLSTSKPKAKNKNDLIEVLTTENDTEAFVLMEKAVDNHVTIEFDEVEESCTECSLLDTAVYTCNIPKGSCNITIMADGKEVGRRKLIKGKDEVTGHDESNLDKIRDILSIETDPIVMLCKALRLPENTCEELDRTLADRCHHYRILETQLNDILHLDDTNTQHEGTKTMWPTLLHFGAEYNLYSYCKELLYFSAMSSQCTVKNMNDETPGEMARKNGFINLANLLEPYEVQQRQKRNSPPVNKDSGFVGDLRRSSKWPSQDEDNEDEGETYIDMQENKKTLPKTSRSDSVLDDVDDDPCDMYDIPPPKPHAPLKKMYANQNIVSELPQRQQQFDTDDNDKIDAYELPPFHPPPCVKRKQAPPITPPPEDSIKDDCGDYMSMSKVPSQNNSPATSIASSTNLNVSTEAKSIFYEDSIDTPDEGSREVFSPSVEVSPPTAHHLSRSHSEADKDRLCNPLPSSHHPHTRHLSISSDHGEQMSPRHSRGGGLFSMLKKHLPHGKHRKQSISEGMIPEELHYKEKKDKHKPHRISDASTTSTTRSKDQQPKSDMVAVKGNSSSEFQSVAPTTDIVERREKSPKEGKHKTKKSKHFFGKKKKMDRRKSVRIAHIMKDEHLTVLDLPTKNA